MYATCLLKFKQLILFNTGIHNLTPNIILKFKNRVLTKKKQKKRKEKKEKIDNNHLNNFA